MILLPTRESKRSSKALLSFLHLQLTEVWGGAKSGLKNRGVVRGKVSERGGCFQCFDPFLLNLELGQLVPQN